MIQKLMAIGCGAPFVVRAAWAFTHNDPRTGVIGVLFAMSNIIIFW